MVPVGIFELLRAVATGQPQRLEYFYGHEGLDHRYACQFVKLGAGVVATNLDITERKTSEQERLRNLRLLEQAEAVADLGSWHYELATGTMHWSEGMYQLFGLPASSPVEPSHYLAAVLKKDRPRAKQLVRQMVAGDEACTLALYRMAQEQGLNVVKHAHGATQAGLELETTPGWVLLHAEDNGPGFAAPPDQSAGLGLRSIRDRVALLGGQLEIGNVPTGGAYVRIRIPLSTAFITTL